MKRKTKAFIQHLTHDLGDEGGAVGEAQRIIDDSLPLVGMVVMSFNRLEQAVNSALCETISDRTDSLGLLIIHGMAYSAKVDLYKRLSEDLHGVLGLEFPAYESLIDRLKEVARLRNLVVHAGWDSTDVEGYTYVRLKLTGRGMDQEYVQFTPESMEKLVDQIEETFWQLDQYLSEREEAVARPPTRMPN